MKPRHYYLRGLTSSWSLYDLSDHAQDEAIEPLAEGLDQQDVIKHLAELTAKSGQADAAHLVIGLPASWCVCAAVSEEGLPRSSAAEKTSALDYRLEAELPITAEACAIDYVGPGPERLGVAVESDRLKALVHALEDAGLSIEAIAPRALIAAQAWLQSPTPSNCNAPTSLCWIEEGDATESRVCQLIHIDPQCPPRWRVIDTHGDSQKVLHQQLEIDGVIASTSDRLWHTSPEATDRLMGVFDPSLRSELLTDTLEAEVAAASAIVSSSEKPWVNLARGPLAPRYHWRRLRLPATTCAAALVMLLISILSVLWLRADAYDRLAEQYDQKSAEVYAQALPGQAVPTSPTRRLQARLKQLRGESGMAGGEDLQAASTPTLLLLHDLLDALPSDQRYAITDLRIEDGQLRMTGYARTHGEADQLANTLRQSTVFVVEPPSTDNLREGGVRFALQAIHSPPEDSEVKPTPKSPATQTPSLAERTKQGGVR